MPASPERADLLTDENKRALTPPCRIHIQPYSEVRLNMAAASNSRQEQV
ncbi:MULTISPECIES: hypothetical protein [unclassified Streptomyces]|nr:hypothetical protein OV320_0225 [Actinobacteria bacterium OV320]